MTLFSETRKIQIFGAQDYMICIAGGIPSDCGDELNATTHEKLKEGGYVGTLLITEGTPEDGIFVHVFYSGSWSFSVCPAGEDRGMPNWPINRSWGTTNEGSETLELEVPKKARLSVVERYE
jgi:hypothetical protein